MLSFFIEDVVNALYLLLSLSVRKGSVLKLITFTILLQVYQWRRLYVFTEDVSSIVDLKS